MENKDAKKVNELFEVVRAELEEQRRHFLDVYNSYDAKYSNIEDSIISQCDKYLDPQQNRGKRLQAIASEIITRVRSFSRKRLSLIEKAGMVGLLAEERATGFFLDFLTKAIFEFPSPSPSDSGTKEILEGLKLVGNYANEVRNSQGFNMLRTMEVMEGNTRVYQLAANLISLRGSSLRQYFDESVREIDLQAIIEAMQRVLLSESREGAKEQLIEVLKKVPEIGATVIGYYVPIAKAVEISIKLKEKVAEIRPTYRKRGPEDNLCDFADLLKDEDEAADLIVEQIDTYLDFLTPPETS